MHKKSVIHVEYLRWDFIGPKNWHEGTSGPSEFKVRHSCWTAKALVSKALQCICS